MRTGSAAEKTYLDGNILLRGHFVVERIIEKYMTRVWEK